MEHNHFMMTMSIAGELEMQEIINKHFSLESCGEDYECTKEDVWMWKKTQQEEELMLKESVIILLLY